MVAGICALSSGARPLASPANPPPRHTVHGCFERTCSAEPRGQTPVPAGARFAASSRGRVYYWIGCSAWRRLAPANLRFFSTRKDAEAAGYSPSRTSGCADPENPSGATRAQRRRPTAPGVAQEAGAGKPLPPCVVSRIIDGDTFRCADGRRVRLLLVDAPETSQGGFGLRATLALESLMPVGSRVRLEADREEHDRYGRTLAHVRTASGTWVNFALVRRGYALAVFYPPNDRYLDRIRAAADSAHAEGAGLWREGGFTCSPTDRRRRRC